MWTEIREGRADTSVAGQRALWRTVRKFLKKLKTDLFHDPPVPLLGIYLEKTIIQKDKCPAVIFAALFTIAKTWKQCKCPSTDPCIKKI